MHEYHRIWLDGHPEYDESWLSQALNAGFEIHHIDGDHSNNDFENLLLVEHGDHMRLHDRAPLARERRSWNLSKEKVRLGEEAYRIRKEEGVTWKEIGVRIGYEDFPGAKAVNVACRYAAYHGLEWPIPHALDCNCSWCGSRRKKGLLESKEILNE